MNNINSETDYYAWTQQQADLLRWILRYSKSRAKSQSRKGGKRVDFEMET
jgi:hypothetical protein